MIEIVPLSLQRLDLHSNVYWDPANPVKGKSSSWIPETLLNSTTGKVKKASALW